MSMDFKRFLLGVACFGMAVSYAYADEAEQPAAQADAPASSIEKVTVVGTRNTRPVHTFPGQIDVLDQDGIQASVPSTVSDLVKDMPNVQFDGGPRRTGEAPNIRGLGGQDVLVLIDGVRQSWTSGHDGRFFLDPNLLVGVEVVKGPASALYGSGALGGVIAFRTAKASDLLDEGMSAGLRATLGYQDVNDEFLRGLTGFTHQGDFDIVANIAQRTSGDIKLGSGFDLQSDDDLVTGFAKFGYSPSEEFSAQVSYLGFHNEAVEPDNGQGISTGTLLNKTVSMDQFAGHFNWKPASASFINMNFVPYHIKGSVDEVDPATNDSLRRDIETTGFSLDNRTPFAFGDIKGLFTIGGEWYEDDQVGHDSTVPGGVRSGVPSGGDNFWGVFAQIEATADRPLGAPGKLTIIPGIRYDSFSAFSAGNPDREESAVSPKIAATYQPTDWFFVFGNTGKAFRAPGINELYLSGIHFEIPHPCNFSPVPPPGCAALGNVANTFVPNPNLEAETSKFWEAGAGFTFNDLVTSDDALLIKGSYWQQDIDNFINLAVNVTFPATCFFPPRVPCNAGTATANNVDAELSGTEIEARYDSDRWRLALGYGTVDGKERGSSFDVTSLPADRFTASATLKLPEIDGRVGARMEIGSDYSKNYNPVTSDPSTEVRDGYTTFDLFATWQPTDDILSGALNGLRVDLGVENVTDEDFERTFEGVSEPGRNFKTLVSYTVQFR
jgi:hemoglobin/transferrin/lactoferrin receptor protein